MSTSLTGFREDVLERLLALLWRQWSAIGVPGYSGSSESRVVDPEPLLLLTLTVGRYDIRLFDERISRHEVEAALRTVNGDRVVARLEGGLDHPGQGSIEGFPGIFHGIEHSNFRIRAVIFGYHICDLFRDELNN